MLRSLAQIKTGLLLFTLLLSFPKLHHLGLTNFATISLTHTSNLSKFSICNFPDSQLLAAWKDYRQALNEYEPDIYSVRSADLIAVYAMDINVSEISSTERLTEAGFLANLTADCTDTTTAQRVKWAKRAEALAGEQVDTNLLLRLGRFYFQERLWAEALPVYVELAQRKPQNGQILLRLGVIYRSLEQHKEAINILSQNLSLPDVDRIQRLALLGNSQFRIGQMDLALETLKQAELEARVLTPPHDILAVIYYYEGLVLEREGKVEMAMEAYQAALAVVPAHNPSLVRLAYIYGERGDYYRAEMYLELLSDTVRSEPKLLCLAFAIKSKIGQEQEAQKLRDSLERGGIKCSSTITVEP